jgi:putative colanic acid biosynthesis UDP-glucose lipid carrier transferase
MRVPGDARDASDDDQDGAPDTLASDPGPPSSLSPRAYRLTGLRPSSMPPPPEEDLLRTLGDLLLAAAHADGEICDRERRTVARVLTELAGGGRLPSWLEAHLQAFDPSTFDLQAATEHLRRLPPMQRRHIAELVRAVCDANNAFDLEEERFLVALVLALSLSPEDVADLVVHAADGLDGLAKRVFDVAFAGAALLAGWPLGLAIALAVRLTSPGPALFKQRRYGRDGEEILVWKFRTMRVSEDGAKVTQASRSDPRVTPLGAFLRRTSLDELPQFINVLRGEMSIVGPRPHAVAHNQQYRTQILEYMLRHKVKPGITGWAQVNGWRGETDTVEKMIERVAHDIEYIRRYDFLFDMKIVFLTVFGRKARRNAY